MLVDVGTVVQKGQTLIQLDNSLLKIQLQSSEVQIEGLEADVKRYLVLAKADAIQEIQLEKSELALKAAKLNRATLMEQINKTAVKAPFGGIITAKLTDEGAFAAPGIPLLQLTNILYLRFTVNIPENDLKYFEEGKLVTVIPDLYPELNLEGKIILTGSKANQANGFPVQILVNNTIGNKIKAGMFGKIKISENDSQKGILIPSSAIVGSAIQPEVYVVTEGKATVRKIKMRGRIAENVIVESGLQVGDMLITGGILNLFEGANVKIK
jgi:RND family efflux transporter MFP subunit